MSVSDILFSSPSVAGPIPAILTTYIEINRFQQTGAVSVHVSLKYSTKFSAGRCCGLSFAGYMCDTIQGYQARKIHQKRSCRVLPPDIEPLHFQKASARESWGTTCRA